MSTRGPKWSECLSKESLEHAGLKGRILAALAIGCIDFRLPRINATAGKILQHSIQTISGLFERNDPMIFKIGFSHDPLWRWSNPLYGYSSAREKWSNMVVLLIADESFTPAMLEAALVEKFSGLLLSIM